MHPWEVTKKIHFKTQVLCQQEHWLACSLQKSKESWSACSYFGLNHTEKPLFLSQAYPAFSPPITADNSFNFSLTKIKISNCFAHAGISKYLCLHLAPGKLWLAGLVHIFNMDIQTQTDTQDIPPEHQETYFTVRVTEHWLRLPRKDVESLSLKIIKSCLDM